MTCFLCVKGKVGERGPPGQPGRDGKKVSDVI